MRHIILVISLVMMLMEILRKLVSTSFFLQSVTWCM